MGANCGHVCGNPNCSVPDMPQLVADEHVLARPHVTQHACASRAAEVTTPHAARQPKTSPRSSSTTAASSVASVRHAEEPPREHRVQATVVAAASEADPVPEQETGPPPPADPTRISMLTSGTASTTMPGSRVNRSTTRGLERASRAVHAITSSFTLGKERMTSVARGSRFARLDKSTTSSASSIQRAQGSVRPTKSRVTGNANMPRDYSWLEDALSALARNKAASLGCTDAATGKAFTPIFFITGGCPNMFCGMQVIMFSVDLEGEVDFWWVKPARSASGDYTLETNTLHRHSKGPHKNDPGRSKPFYKPLADLFHKGGQSKDGFRFGVEMVGGRSTGDAPRAFIEKESGDGQSDGRWYLYLVWQEDWTTNPFSRSKYIEGKIVYQKDPEVPEFFCRQYCILNGAMTIADYEEQPFATPLPGDEVKYIWEE